MSGTDTHAMRFGLVGYGAFGRLHAQCIDRVADATLSAICARSDEAAARARADFPNITVYRDYRDLVADAGIDVVDVVTPNDTHAEIGEAALEAGKDLLLEKPMANTVEDCDLLIAAARRSGRLINVGHELRLSTQWGTIKRLIDDGAIGRPAYANLSLFRHPYRPGARGWRHDPRRVGSWILEEPVHFYDLIMWYFEACGDPEAVRAMGSSSGRAASGQPGMDDNFSSVLTFPGGRYATITQTLAGFEHHTLLEIMGDDGALRSWWSGGDARALQPSFELKVMARGAHEPEVFELASSGEIFELEEEIRQTVVAFRERRTLVSGEDARKRIAVCLAAERSVREAREIGLDL